MKKFLKWSLLLLNIYLPFQIALNPTKTIDLASVRVLILVIFAFLLFLKLKEKKSLIFDKTAKLLLLFLFLNTLSLFFAQNPIWSLKKLAFLFSIFPLFFVIQAIIHNKKRLYSFLVFLVLGASLAATIGIIQFLLQFVFGQAAFINSWQTIITPFLGNNFSQMVFNYPSWFVHIGDRDYFRAIAFFPDPHMFSYYLELILPWSIALTFIIKKQRCLFIFSSLLIFIANLLTFTRGSYLAILAGYFVFALFVYKSSWKNKSNYALPISIGAIILIFFLLLPSSPVGERAITAINTQEGSNQGRIHMWNIALKTTYQHPFGVGLGNYPLQVASDATYRQPIYAHNIYLDIAIESGVQALACWLLLLFAIIKSYWIKAQENPLFLAGVVSIIIYSVHGLVETPLFSVHILTLFTILTALSTYRHENETKPTN